MSGTQRRAEEAGAGVLVLPVELGTRARGWFTGRATDHLPRPAVGQSGNLAHRRPHVPSRLAADRRDALGQMGIALDDTVWMRQVHGREVGIVDDRTPPGAQLQDVDALVTEVPGRALVVQVADCVPVLLASETVVAAAHAGRRGLEQGVLEATLDAMWVRGAAGETVTAAIGPAIGGCCYEVPAEMREDLADLHPVAAGTTDWGTPSLDLPAAVEHLLEARGVRHVERVGGCTHCDPRWFSHRRDPEAGRQVGVVVLDAEPA